MDSMAIVLSGHLPDTAGLLLVRSPEVITTRDRPIESANLNVTLLSLELSIMFDNSGGNVSSSETLYLWMLLRTSCTVSPMFFSSAACVSCRRSVLRRTSRMGEEEEYYKYSCE